MLLVQPMASLTDLALGLVTLFLAWRLPRTGDAARYWRWAFASAAVTALAGAVLHGFLIDIPRVSTVAWALTSVMVVVVMTFLLAATVMEVVGRGRAAIFWPLRMIGLIAYTVIAATGHPSITAILWCESLTMAAVIGLWIWAWTRHHPSSGRMLIAIAVSVAAGLLRLVPGAAAAVGLDADSAYHLVQIPGMVLLFYAVVSMAGQEAARGRSSATGPG